MAATISAVGSSYESLLLTNASRIASIESSLRSLTWFLPGRFQDSELASEALYSLLNILGLYHDSILSRRVSTLPAPLRPTPTSHSRYTRHWTSTSPSYATLARSLTVLSHLELLLEMALRKRKGVAAASDAVVVIEGVKAALRLALMRTTGGRTAVQPPIAEREVDPALLEAHKDEVLAVPTRVRSGAGGAPRSAADVLLGGEEGESVEEEHKEYWKGARTGYARPTIASIRVAGDAVVGDPTSTGGKESVQQYLLTRVLTVEDVKRPEDLVARAKGLGKVAEIIWIMRPLLYVLAMRRYGRRHTLPYLLSLALEYLAFSLRQTSATRLAGTKASGPMLPNSQSEVERAETKKRARAFWWYLVRGPVWESWTKPQLEAVSRKFDDKPLIGFVSTLIRDYVPLIDDYYFYTS